MATLADINATLQSHTPLLDATNRNIERMVADQERSRLDQLEMAREQRAQQDRVSRSGGGGNNGGSSALGGFFGGFAGAGGGLAKGAAGVAALGLALPAFFGGLLAGEAALDWLDTDLNFDKLKQAAIGFTDIITDMNPAAFTALAGIMAISAFGGVKSAMGLGAMGTAITAFLGGLLIGDGLFSGVSALGADFDFTAMKQVMSGFSEMILSLDKDAAIAIAGIMGLSALTGMVGRDPLGAAKALGALSLGIAGFLGGLVLANDVLGFAETQGADLNFTALSTVLAGFSSSISALTPEAAIALAGIIGASGVAAIASKAGGAGLGIASTMTGIGAGISGLMIGLTAGNAALTWIDGIAGVGGDGLKNAFALFNDIVGELNNPAAITALAAIITAGAVLGVATTPAGAIAAGVGIMATMTSIGFGISGLMIGLAAGGKITDMINAIPIGSGEGLTSVVRMFNDMVLALTPEAIDRMAVISKKDIGGGLVDLAAGIVAMMGAEGIGKVAGFFKRSKEALLGAVDWIFGTELAGGESKSTIERMIDGLTPITNLPDNMLAKINEFSGALTGLADSFGNLQNVSVENTSTNLSRMVKDVAGVMSMWPHLTGDNPEPYNPIGGSIFGRDAIDFGGGLKNITAESVSQVTEGLASIRAALGVPVIATAPTAIVEAPAIERPDTMGQSSVLRDLYVENLVAERMAAGSVIINAPTDARSTTTSTSGVSLSGRLTASDLQRMLREQMLQRPGR